MNELTYKNKIMDIIRKSRRIKQSELLKKMSCAKNTFYKYVKELIKDNKICIIPFEAFEKYRIKDKSKATYYTLGESSDFSNYVKSVVASLSSDLDLVFENAVEELINFGDIVLEPSELLSISANLVKEVDKETEERYEEKGKIKTKIIKNKEIVTPYFCNKLVKLLKIQIDSNNIILKDSELAEFINNLISCFFRQGNILNERYDIKFMSMIARQIEENIRYKAKLRNNIIYIISKLKSDVFITKIFIPDINNNLDLIGSITGFPKTNSFQNFDFSFNLKENVWDNLVVSDKLAHIIYLNYVSNDLKSVFNSDASKYQLFEYINDDLSNKNLRNVIKFVNKIRLENS